MRTNVGVKKLTIPIFYDPHRRRWRRFKRAIQALSGVCSVILATLITSILLNPALPSLGLAPARTLPQVHHLAPPQAKHLPTRPERKFQKTKRQLTSYLAQAHPAVVLGAAPVPRKPSELMGFYVNWDDTSFTSLKQHLATLDKLIPEWLHLASSDGTVTSDDPAKQRQVLAYVREHRAALAIVPLVNNFNSERMQWEGKKLAAMLTQPVARARTIQSLLQFVQDNHCAGISIDFEEVPSSAQPALRLFMTELYAWFHPLGLEVSQSVPLNDPSFAYRELAKSTDYLILMAYDEHWSSSPAGPISSQEWYATALRHRFAELPALKYVVAIGNYGYDWAGKGKTATELSFQEALKTAQESEGHITLDPDSLNPTFSYYDDSDKLHHVWFLDGVTAFNQLVEGQRQGPRGFALWRLGSEDPSIWPVFERRQQLDRAAADTLQVLHYGYDLDYEGAGEVLKVTATPSDGARKVTYDDKSGLITAERLRSFASPYVITRWGATKKKYIALTFDDGPDAQYTPAILDILRRYQVPATFFIIGFNGELHGDLLHQIVTDGHEIGNHTFTHPNVGMISQKQLGLEINATERLIESRLGLRAVLFRPPYAEDIEPETPDQVKPLLFTSDRGYYTIGMQIDPSDWQNPGVEQIVQRTITSAEQGEGKVVLLHDGGGERSQTVAALPQIIESLQTRGFTLVPISRLLGLSREAVMPPLPQEDRLGARMTELGFMLIDGAITTLYTVFLVGIMLAVLRLIFIGTLALRQRWRKRIPVQRAPAMLSVSVIVPAYNEEKVIGHTIASLLATDYPNFDIIVVDDGSQDKTALCVQERFGDNRRVRLLTKPNGGKAQALNYGVAHTQAEIVVCLDADTLFRPDTISKLVAPFTDPKVGAVAGNAKVGNRINVLTKWQALEYITSQNLDRRAFAVLNCISVVPGAVGAWRRPLLVQARGFTADTLAEDADLTLTILRMGYEIAYEDEAIALTEAPDTLRGFVNQRFRWMYGTLQAVWKHWDTAFRPRYGALGIVAIPNVLLFQILLPLLSPVMDLLMAWALLNTAWQRSQHPLDYSTDSLQRVLFYYALFLALDFLATLVAFGLERNEEWSLLVWLFLQRFVYRQVMYYVAIKATLTAIRGTLVSWGKLERKATVPVGGQV